MTALPAYFQHLAEATATAAAAPRRTTPATTAPRSPSGAPVAPASFAPFQGLSTAINSPGVPGNLSSYQVNASAARTDPEQGAAALTRAQYRYFKERVAPIENEALKAITNKNTPRQVANQAANQAARHIRDLRGLEERAVGTYGVQLKGDERRVVTRQFGLDRALGIAGAWNTAYTGTQDMVTTAAGDALQIGRGVAGQASRGLGAAAQSFVGARNAQEAQAQADQSSRFSTIASGAGLGAALAAAGGTFGSSFLPAMMAGGPAGAVVGGAVGLLASFL